MFLSLSKNYWKNGRSLAKKFKRPGKNSGNVGRMEEALEEEISQSYKKYFFSFSKKYWKNGRSYAKKFTRPGKNSGNVGRLEEAPAEVNRPKL